MIQIFKTTIIMKPLFLTIALLVCTVSINAQNHPPKPPTPPKPPKFEKIKALKTAHITNALDLSEKEAEKFWPIYNSAEAKRIALKKQAKQLIKQAGKIKELSDAKSKELLEKSIALEHQMLNKKEEMLKSVAQSLSAKKALMLQKAERSFKQKLLRRMKAKKRAKTKKTK